MEARSSIQHGPLQRFVGSWQGEGSVEAADGSSQRYTQHNTFAWALGGAFLEERGQASDGSSFLGMWLLDPGSGLYRAHYFLSPSGSAVTLTQEWNEAQHTFSGSADLGGGMRMLTRDHFLDRDSYEWSITIQDAAGKLVQRMQAREQRKVS